MEHRPNDQTNRNLLYESAFAIGCELDNVRLEQLNCYVKELLLWNEKSNLTGFDTEKDVIGSLVVDSLAAVSLFEELRPSAVLDVGTGGGIPGIPLKIAFPSTKLTLVEPNHKKVAFLHYAVGTLGLKNVHIEAARIEQIRNDDQYHGVFDLVVIKALRLDRALPYLGDVLSKDGCVLCWRSESLNAASGLCGFRVLNEFPYQLPFGLGHRIISVLGI